MMRRRALLAESQTGGGFGEPFSFYIAENFFSSNYIEYIALEGMTWEDWIYSKYNIDNFTIDNSWGDALIRNIDGLAVSNDIYAVTSTDIIIANNMYDLQP